jgi:hypothetical protein
LLTCDCVLLALDGITHILQYYQCILDWQHTNKLQGLDEEQIAAHQQQQQQLQQQQQRQQQQSSIPTGNRSRIVREQPSVNYVDVTAQQSLEELSRDIDRRMETLEQQHVKKIAIFDTIVYMLQLLTDLLTIAHFLHIWTLHGIHFTFIDGVIALHLHSSVLSALKKIAERRAIYRIAREMDEIFTNASELDLQKASVSGDVCCICLGTMNFFPSATTISDGNRKHNSKDHRHSCNVKKVACGHLYHTTCLREVIERARSIEAARCPLCRAYFVKRKEEEQPQRNASNQQALDPIGAVQEGSENRNGDFTTAFRDPLTGNRDNNHNRGASNNAPGAGAVDGEHALFRFSTEGLFPAWVPLPAFMFEVVRRPPINPGDSNVATTDVGTTNNDNPNEELHVDDATENTNNAEERLHTGPNHHQPQEQSLFRRFLLLTGAVSMSPAEELAALEQLVDMFPQYDRHDLQRALRDRGSIESVVESILTGVFVGIPRGIDDR